MALAANGGVASASSIHNNNPGQYGPAGAINGDRRGTNWGGGGGWNDATPNSWPDWLAYSNGEPEPGAMVGAEPLLAASYPPPPAEIVPSSFNPRKPR